MSSTCLVLIDIGVQQLLVAAVDDGGPVTGGKHMGHAIAVEGLQADRLAAQAQLLPVTYLPCTEWTLMQSPLNHKYVV